MMQALLSIVLITHMGIDASEFQARRQAVMNAAPDGIVLLHSFSAPKGWRDPGFQQDSNFFYLSGFQNLHDAILAIDGTTKETWLFVKPPTEREQRRFAGVLAGWDSVFLTGTEQFPGIEHVVVWDELFKFIEARRKTIYLDQSSEGRMVADVSNPPDLAPIENPYLLWTLAIKAKWPDATIKDASPILQNIRAVKSPAELALMRKADAFTDAGMRAAIAAIAPGHTNREVEAAAVAGAMRAGADGIGMWPEVKSGPVNGRTIFQKFYDYHLRNRTMQRGETVLMDIGFSYQFYKGDIGRTVPVSGHFSAEQREVMDLMTGAHESGLRALHDGVRAEEIVRACSGYVEEHRPRLRSELARRAAVELLKPGTWLMYTHGLDMVEIFPVKELHTGNAVAFGPEFNVDGMGFYREDVVLITPNGYQLLQLH